MISSKKKLNIDRAVIKYLFFNDDVDENGTVETVQTLGFRKQKRLNNKTKEDQHLPIKNRF